MQSQFTVWTAHNFPLFYFFNFAYLFWMCHMACGILVPQPGILIPWLCPLQWKRRVLTTGPPGNPAQIAFKVNLPVPPQATTLEEEQIHKDGECWQLPGESLLVTATKEGHRLGHAEKIVFQSSAMLLWQKQTKPNRGSLCQASKHSKSSPHHGPSFGTLPDSPHPNPTVD